MKNLFVLAISVMCFSAKANIVEFYGAVDAETGVLSLTVNNTSKKAMCIKDWSYPDDEFPTAPSFDEYIIVDERGSNVPFDGPVLMPSSVSKSHFFIVLSPGSKITKKIDLNKVYRLSSGNYTLTYFKSVIDCAALSKEQIDPESSLYIKFLYMKNDKNFHITNLKINEFNSKIWRKYGFILSIEDMKFNFSGGSKI